MVLSLYTHGKKINKQKAEEVRRLALVFPCSFGTFPTRERSKRRIKHDRPIVKATNEEKKKEKMHSGEFDCYFLNLWKGFSEDKRSEFAYLDSMWFGLYLTASFKGKVLTWIRTKQIFSKTYVIVPIVCWGHWSVLILCHLGETSESKDRTPCMLLLDSLEKANPRRLEPDIRKFVLDIYGSEGRAANKKLISKIPLLVPKVPQQRNGEECGNYVLYFINLFMQNAPGEFSINKYPYFMDKNWFSPECLMRFFEELELFEK
ncbi:probable ubiquitin-like-specific protease 2A isoform X2 [Mercurialis annua]|nr:probable ubiquitin-like-specific protease 2A isoform X2 [Mercurialis annua]